MTRLPLSRFAAAMALAVMMPLGCSRSSQPLPPGAGGPSQMIDLGAVELTPAVPKPFTLGPHQSCVITGKELTNGIEMKLDILTTNASGIIIHSLGTIRTVAGRACGISMGDVGVTLTATLKTK